MKPIPIGGDPRRGRTPTHLGDDPRKKSKPIEWWSDRIDNFHKEGHQFAGRCPCHEDDDMSSLKMKPVDGPALTIVNCQAGCEFDDVFDAVMNEVEPGMIPDKSPIKIKTTTAPKFKKVRVSEPSNEKPPTAKKKSPISITRTEDASGLSPAAKWWQEYTGIPWSEWESWGVVDDDDKVCFTWPGVKVVKYRPRGGSTGDIKWEPAKSKAPSLWPLPGDTLEDQIWLGEGESSTGVLLHLGFEAYSVTKGAHTELRPVELSRLYERGARDVIICFDTDSSGVENAYRMKSQIDASPLNAYLVDLNDELDPLRGESDLRDL